MSKTVVKSEYSKPIFSNPKCQLSQVANNISCVTSKSSIIGLVDKIFSLLRCSCP